ncbi:MAG: 30S ribosomal protein S9 [Clostridia bacterium]|nr:30S ribosomal protein S9 [Clostridia bacterium]
MAKKTAKVEKIWATGRRKKAIARARICAGKGNILVNKEPLADYFKSELLQNEVKTALNLVEVADKYDIEITVTGGGLSGQAGACRHAIARALVLSNETFKKTIKSAGLLTRDPRMKERKKYGLKKARKAPQFSKR